ncbi:MAG: ferritin-like protein [Myxococcales bacterium]|nr:ferritin-like protein [Myxococcales bacterium]
MLQKPSLVRRLHTAMTIELSTLPTYLYTAWTLRNNSAPARQAMRLIASVAYEEMLHMALVANVTRALGHKTAINDPEFVPDFSQPLNLPGHSNRVNEFRVVLRPFGADAIQTFLDIELPRQDARRTVKGWSTIGEFYDELKRMLPVRDGAYTPDSQLPKRDNPGGGVLFRVASHADAVAAIDQIQQQGEGSTQADDDGDHELAHYYKFLQVQTLLTTGQIDLARDVWPVVDDPHGHLGAYTKAQLAANLAFNSAYSALLDALQDTVCSASPGVYGASTQAMEALPHLAAVLRAQGPIPGTDRLAGPTFAYVAAADRPNGALS